jgi:hypothetical protein
MTKKKNVRKQSQKSKGLNVENRYCRFGDSSIKWPGPVKLVLNFLKMPLTSMNKSLWTEFFSPFIFIPFFSIFFNFSTSTLWIFMPLLAKSPFFLRGKNNNLNLCDKNSDSGKKEAHGEKSRIFSQRTFIVGGQRKSVIHSAQAIVGPRN